MSKPGRTHYCHSIRSILHAPKFHILFSDYTIPSSSEPHIFCRENTLLPPTAPIFIHIRDTSKIICWGRKLTGDRGYFTTTNDQPWHQTIPRAIQVWWDDLANKNTGHPVKFKLLINNSFLQNIKMS